MQVCARRHLHACVCVNGWMDRYESKQISPISVCDLNTHLLVDNTKKQAQNLSLSEQNKNVYYVLSWRMCFQEENSQRVSTKTLRLIADKFLGNTRKLCNISLSACMVLQSNYVIFLDKNMVQL